MPTLEEDLRDAHKGRGAFFTPEEIADFLVEWSIRSPSDVVLEPSCGEAVFLLAALRRLLTLSTGGGDGRVVGVDIHEPSVRLAASDVVRRMNWSPALAVTNFFDLRPSGSFDVVVGNPPYIRYQGFTGSARAKGQLAARDQGVMLGGLASSWAPFLVHCSAFLKPEGRLGLVLPAELLSVNYAAPVRRFLLERFDQITLVLFEERVFPGVLEEVVLLLATGSGGTDRILVARAKNAGDLRNLARVGFKPEPPEGKWTAALIENGLASIYARRVDGRHFVGLREWGDPNLGIVTGNNDFFCLSPEQAHDLGISADELLRISPPGSRHLRGLELSEARWQELAKEGKRVYLFYPGMPPSPAATRYIAAGEETGVHLGYKCRVRSPWWRVPLVPVPDLFLTYMNHDAPRLVANNASVLPLNSIHALRARPNLRSLARDLLPLGMLNSVTLLAGELLGRAYGGGILKIEPKEADVLPVPAPEVLVGASRALLSLRNECGNYLSRGQLARVAELVDEALFERPDPSGREEIRLIADAWERLQRRRTSRRSSI